MTLPYRVGLTGGIGSGKTTVCNLFSKLDVPIIDADIISREVVEPGSIGLKQLVNQFGESILNSNKSLDRKKIRELAFNDDEFLRSLNSIIHPLVYSAINDKVNRITTDYCIISIPLLFETGGDKYVDRVLLIDTSYENQILRSILRDDEEREQIERIIRAQMSREERLKRADDIIHNDSSLDNLELQVKTLHQSYLKLSKTN